MIRSIHAVVRPVEMRDLPKLCHLAEVSGVGLTTLPVNEELLQQRIATSEKSLNNKEPNYRQGDYLFVLEDLESQQVVGTSGIYSCVGHGLPCYHYRLTTLAKSCEALGLYKELKALSLSNDYHGASEIGTLFLHPDFRAHKNGHLLSRSRFLFMAQFPDRFDDTVIAEMRGVSSTGGYSPFWEGLGANFFDLEFKQADYLTGIGNKQFISDMVPRHPIYTELLPESAREVIGQVHQDTAPALTLLEKEGFFYKGYVDIFDGGPTVEAQLKYIRSVRKSMAAVFKGYIDQESGELVIASNCSLGFRSCVTRMLVEHDQAYLTVEIAEALQVQPGDQLRYILLDVKKEEES
ncbi:arginine N-succinyltransferase [Piscirickettsia salmonis]|uniref:arginine N-succinyltransferase n=1 Tax=Piscirickettsia salmonis TaxID=1238 RepID=UPI00137BA2F6|nr:arginine N-succinyltransferase [Piscirickettsia salmonis]QHS29582.1 arginine N-succinyltransferase [Piscirickettsia salmonis]